MNSPLLAKKEKYKVIDNQGFTTTYLYEIMFDKLNEDEKRKRIDNWERVLRGTYNKSPSLIDFLVYCSYKPPFKNLKYKKH